MNGHTDEAEIARVLGDKFATTFTRDPSSSPAHHSMVESNRLLLESCNDGDHPLPLVTIVRLSTAIQALHSGKSADGDGLCAEHLKHITNPEFLEILCTMFTRFFSEGQLPPSMSHANVTPLVKKPAKGYQDPNNYRGISLISIFGKVFELLILQLCPQLKQTSILQHGFKRGSSTTHAAYILRETQRHYRRRKSSLYVCALDAAKAFDGVDWDCLFYKLQAVLSPLVWRALYHYYLHSRFKMQYRSATTEEYPIERGVKQGGILSPYLFAFFVDDMLKQAKDRGLGARLDSIFVGLICYADDILLVARSPWELQQMMDDAVEYFDHWKLKFNASKTEICCFGPMDQNVVFRMKDSLITPQSCVAHLGITWDSTLKDPFQGHVDDRIMRMKQMTAALINKGIQSMHGNSIAHIFKLQILPLAYCMELGAYTATQMAQFTRVVRQCFKRLVRCSKYCRNVVLEAFNIPDFETFLHRKLASTLRQIAMNDYTNTILQFTKTQPNTKKRHEKYLWQVIQDTSKTSNPINCVQAILGSKSAVRTPKLRECGRRDTLRSLIPHWGNHFAMRCFRAIVHDKLPDRHRR